MFGLAFALLRGIYLGINLPGVPKPLSPAQRDILNQYFEYFKLLPASEKVAFESRIAQFLAHKKFIPRNMDAVTDEMRVLIAATAIKYNFSMYFH